MIKTRIPAAESPKCGKLLESVFAVALLKAINTAGFFLKVHIARVKRMIFGVNLAAIHSVIRLHGASGLKLRSVAEDYGNFVVFRVNAFFHEIVKFLNCLFSVANIRV